MEENFDFDAEFRVRLPSELADRIAQTAKKERRSRNLQYVYMLENWFEMKDKLEERVTRLETLTAEQTDGSQGKEKAGERRKKAAM